MTIHTHTHTHTHSETINKEIDQLFSSILQEQRGIAGVRGADPEKALVMERRLKDYENNRGRGYTFQYLSSGRGHGPFTELVDGSVKYDLINAIGVNLLGHSHPLCIRAALEAATADTMMCGNLLPHQEAAEATEAILSTVRSSTRLAHFWYACSGSFANDTALKIIWQKRAPRRKVLCFEKAFAGRSIAMQDITYNEEYRQGMPQYLDVVHIPHYDQRSPETATEKTIMALNAAWEKNPDEFAVLMLELVQGEAGFIYGTKEYYQAVCLWAKEKQIPIWFDEVQTFGRTRQLFAFQMFGLEEYVDVVTLAKAFQGAGVLYTADLNPKPGLIAGTFNGSIPALKLATKTIRYLTEGPFYGEDGIIAQLEKKFKAMLEAVRAKTGHIHYVGGVGTMISIQVGKSDKDDTNKFIKKLFDNGIITFSAGKDPARVRFLLPLAITDAHIQEIQAILEKTLVETFAQ